MNRHKAILSSIIASTMVLFAYVLITSFTEKDTPKEKDQPSTHLVGTHYEDLNFMNNKN